jgi:hypothetical protein
MQHVAALTIDQTQKRLTQVHELQIKTGKQRSRGCWSQPGVPDSCANRFGGPPGSDVVAGPLQSEDV